MKLACRLQHPGLESFRKHDPLGMPLQLLNDTADKTHGMLVSDRLGFRNFALVEKQRASTDRNSEDRDPKSEVWVTGVQTRGTEKSEWDAQNNTGNGAKWCKMVQVGGRLEVAKKLFKT
jgi:hypothetical protein